MNIRYGAALATLTLIAACGSRPATTMAAGSSTVRCPATALHTVLPAGGADGAALVPRGPRTAVICQYAMTSLAGKVTGLPVRITLTGVAAAGLAAVLDSALPVTPEARRCARPAHLDPFAQVIVFGYGGGREQRAAVAFTDCDFALVAVGPDHGELPMQTDADLFEYTSLTATRDGSTMEPDLIGLSATAAARQAHRQHFTVYIDGAVLDPGVAAGTVVFQSPPAGAHDSLPGRDVAVILATRKVPACTASQLALSYLNGGAGAGSDFGTLLVRDSSARPCTLTGPLTVTGLGTDGRPDTTTRGMEVTGPAVLTQNAGPVRWRPPGELAGTRPGELTGVLRLISEYRDGPASVDGGLCQPLWVVPATWRVGLPDGRHLLVRNADPANPAGLVRSGGFVTCRGQLGVIQPASVTSP